MYFPLVSYVSAHLKSVVRTLLYFHSKTLQIFDDFTSISDIYIYFILLNYHSFGIHLLDIQKFWIRIIFINNLNVFFLSFLYFSFIMNNLYKKQRMNGIQENFEFLFACDQNPKQLKTIIIGLALVSITVSSYLNYWLNYWLMSSKDRNAKYCLLVSFVVLPHTIK